MLGKKKSVAGIMRVFEKAKLDLETLLVQKDAERDVIATKIVMLQDDKSIVETEVVAANNAIKFLNGYKGE